MGEMINILVIEANTSIIQEVLMFLSDKSQCQITNLSLPGENDGILSFPGLKIYIHKQTVYHNATLIPLTHHEFFTLLYLAQHPSWVFSQSTIYEAVWKEPGDKCGSAVVNVVSQIRRKIGDEYIETVVGSGYRFVG